MNNQDLAFLGLGIILSLAGIITLVIEGYFDKFFKS